MTAQKLLLPILLCALFILSQPMLIAAADTGTIVTRVWDDQNGDGRQNENANISGVTVNLLDPSNNVVDTAVTNASGQATFTPPVGSYRLQYVLPPDHAFTVQDASGVPDDKDSDPRRSNGRTGTFTVGAGQTITTWDAGLWSPGQVQARAWDDRNGDGRQNESNSNVAGVVVNLLEANNTPVINPHTTTAVTATTGTNGIAILPYVPADRAVKLEFVLPTDHAFTIKDALGVPDDKNSDARTNNGRTDTFQADRGSQTFTTWDAGLWAPGQVQARVWDDRNGDGRQNESNSNIAGVVVNLLEANNTPVINPNTTTAVTATTGTNGIAILPYVPANRAVKLEFVLPTDHAFTIQDGLGVPDDKDSDARTNNGRTDTFQADRGSQTFTTWDAGLWAPGQVQARVWDDRNGDGRQNESNSNIAGVVVRLLEDNNSPVINPNTTTAVTATTGTNGIATLPYVPANRVVKLEFVLPTDHVFTEQNKSGVPDDKDSDARTNNGRTDTFQANKGSQTFTTWDAGLWSPGVIQARVWEDRNEDGRQNESNSNIAGVVVRLLEDNNSPVINPNTTTAVTATTGTNGIATLPYLPANRAVKLEFVLPVNYRFTTQNAVGVPADKDSDARTSNGRTNTFRVTQGDQTITTWDAGLIYETPTAVSLASYQTNQTPTNPNIIGTLFVMLLLATLATLATGARLLYRHSF